MVVRSARAQEASHEPPRPSSLAGSTSHEPLHHTHEHYHVEHFYWARIGGGIISSATSTPTTTVRCRTPLRSRELRLTSTPTTAHNHRHDAGLDYNAEARRRRRPGWESRGV